MARILLVLISVVNMEYLTLAIILSFEAGIFFVFAFTTINIIFSILFYILSFNLIIVSLFYCRKSKKIISKY